MGSQHVRHHHGQADLELQTIASLQLVRSLLLDSIEMVAIREPRQDREGAPQRLVFQSRRTAGSAQKISSY